MFLKRIWKRKPRNVETPDKDIYQTTAVFSVPVDPPPLHEAPAIKRDADEFVKQTEQLPAFAQKSLTKLMSSQVAQALRDDAPPGDEEETEKFIAERSIADTARIQKIVKGLTDAYSPEDRDALAARVSAVVNNACDDKQTLGIPQTKTHEVPVGALLHMADVAAAVQETVMKGCGPVERPRVVAPVPAPAPKPEPESYVLFKNDGELIAMGPFPKRMYAEYWAEGVRYVNSDDITIVGIVGDVSGLDIETDSPTVVEE